MSKLTLPIQVGKSYKRRDGVIVRVVEVTEQGHFRTDAIDGAADGYVVTGRGSKSAYYLTADLVADHLETTGHVHAELMALYARDAAETFEPWLLWQYYAQDKWHDILDMHPRWAVDTQYRRKPKTIRIGEFDVPEPMREAPAHGVAFYSVCTDGWQSSRHAFAMVLSQQWHWTDHAADKARLARGICHLNEKDAELHAKALLSLTKP